MKPTNASKKVQFLFLLHSSVVGDSPTAAQSTQTYTLCNIEGKGGSNAYFQFFPTRMLGLRRGSKFGSEPAEARPSLAMTIINVKKPKTPTRRRMKTRCFHEKDVRFLPVRFLKR